VARIETGASVRGLAVVLGLEPAADAAKAIAVDPTGEGRELLGPDLDDGSAVRNASRFVRQ
jgi:hypothetical protein